MKPPQLLLAVGLTALILFVLGACATVPKKSAAVRPIAPPVAKASPPVVAPKVAPRVAKAAPVTAAPKAAASVAKASPPVAAPKVTMPDTGSWKLSEPVTTGTQLADLFGQAIDRTVTSWKFTWSGANRDPLTNERFGKASADALASAKRGGGYFEGYEWTWTQRSDSPSQQVVVNLHYRFPPDTIATRVAEADQVASDAVATLVKPGMADFQKELVLHDWLVSRARYDLANYDAKTVPDSEYTPYGVLVQRIGVCESYATAFQLLATKAGLDGRIVSGKGNGDAHAWNQVKVDGSWYNLDVTWDDPVGATDQVNHTYFNIDDRALAASHEWDRSLALPCSSDAANWYVHEGLVTNDLKELASQVRDVVRKRQPGITLKVRDFDGAHFQSDVNAILKKVAEDSRTSLKWTTSIDEGQGVVDVKYSY